MENKGLANSVLGGSRNLNQMKRDIRDTCKLIAELFGNVELSDQYIEKNYGSDRCFWRIRLQKTTNPSNAVELYCGIKQSDGSVIRGLQYESDGEFICYFRQTQNVYCELDVLMNGISEEFDKEIGNKLKILLEASKQVM